MPERERNFAQSSRAQTRLHEMVPGGAHTNARGSDQFPDGIAPIIVRGEGARVYDVDGNWFVEYGAGLKSVTLGHGYAPVVQRVCEAARSGVNFTRPSVWEVQAAERFLDMVPTVDMVKFAKNGSDVTTAAVKLARAATGRDLVAVCRTQPFFSVDDWFMTTTAMSSGIPRAVGDLTVSFDFNDLESLRTLLVKHPGQIAGIVLEPATGTREPQAGFLEGVRELADRDGAVLIFDEMITGMRWSSAGAQSVYGVTPDLSTWGKALGNGFSVSALAGAREIMELGGLNTDKSRVFLLSNTHGAETTGLAAYLAVADSYSERDVVAEMEAAGAKLQIALLDAIAAAGMSDFISVFGRASALVFGTRDAAGAPSQAYRALLLQELLRHGVLCQSLVISAAHTDDDIGVTVEAFRRASEVYARAIESGTTEGLLVGRPVAPAIREFAAPRKLEV
ncbi:glutamate-1-semialdehyde 2,1-aminomutase [Microbacterium sp. MPKO10]|uniref:glutamate-1-semialdehyde 2,1-aminomutase n=1 Tax=Microbacterium sp. MPKO10 TaxID=2989818 RepID=UPI002235EEF8|nr:glutamate-1-semialdehyde 2,1-aminomutase [Microbacterium sp. MPKO10]MCW4458863.1 glutamate-1-semialdehyde 2,1-aminomutase [Microbacterium sp. MPKO10]